jgi:hypothetical protein
VIQIGAAPGGDKRGRQSGATGDTGMTVSRREALQMAALGAAAAGVASGAAAASAEAAGVACGPGVIPLVGRVELGALRRARAARLEAHEGRFRPEAVADAYAAFPGFPLNCFLDKPMIEAWEGSDIVRAQIEKLLSTGIFRAPR